MGPKPFALAQPTVATDVAADRDEGTDGSPRGPDLRDGNSLGRAPNLHPEYRVNQDPDT